MNKQFLLGPWLVLRSEPSTLVTQGLIFGGAPTVVNLSRDITETELIDRFKGLRENLLPLTISKYEKRAFVYFDMIAWLDSKIHKKSVESIIKDRMLVAVV